jgi:hypothetical protein
MSYNKEWFKNYYIEHREEILAREEKKRRLRGAEKQPSKMTPEELEQYQKKRQYEYYKKYRERYRGLSKEDRDAEIAEKRRKKKEEARKERDERMKVWKMDHIRYETKQPRSVLRRNNYLDLTFQKKWPYAMQEDFTYEGVTIRWTKEYRVEYARHYYHMLRQNKIKTSQYKVSEFIQEYYHEHDIILTTEEAEKMMKKRGQL